MLWIRPGNVVVRMDERKKLFISIINLFCFILLLAVLVFFLTFAVALQLC